MATVTSATTYLANIHDLHFSAADDPGTKGMTALRVDHSNDFVLQAALDGHAAANQLDIADSNVSADDISGLDDRLGHDITARDNRGLDDVVLGAGAERIIE